MPAGIENVALAARGVARDGDGDSRFGLPRIALGGSEAEVPQGVADLPQLEEAVAEIVVRLAIGGAALHRARETEAGGGVLLARAFGASGGVPGARQT